MTHLALEAGSAHPTAPRDDIFDPGLLKQRVRAAEDAGFVLITFADGPTAEGIEAGVRAAFLATGTTVIGLAPQLHTATTEPFHLATQLASLDHTSRGRAGWVVGAAADPASLATIGREDAPAGEIRDVIEVARRLWDSWEDDAIIRDARSGRFLDPDRVHHVNFAGGTFGIVGPLITPRPPQGQVVVLGADTLGVTGQLDIALVGDTARAQRARTDGAALVFAELEVLLDTTDDTAVERLATLGPWPEHEDRLRFIGSLDGLHARIEELAGTVDGVRLHPAVLADDLPVLVTRRTGSQRGTTLRDTLGLPRPANRYERTPA
ncbi:LLM class flavin-dependent oxidoreductase [Catenuloplanes sp. NPDC051500]|uniref:LLM class flavin-dependent oxidoreductase n=1 Tax=Catenuloplanes sp. NPDC051500 TaxID=3363959 RepID=UPI0037933149